MRRLFTAATLATLATVAPTQASVNLQPLHPAEGPATGNAEKKWAGGNFPDTSFEGVRYVSSRFLESLFGREGAWVPDRQKFVIPDSSGRKWFFTLDNPYMNVGDEVLNLAYPVRRGPEYLYLPIPTLLRILNAKGIAVAAPEAGGPEAGGPETSGPEAPASTAPIAIDSHPAAEKTAKTSSLPGGSNILDVGAEDRDNGTLVSVRTAGPMEYESFWVPPHFILKFQGGQLAPQYPIKAQGQGLVKNILTTQEKDLVQITLNIPKPVDTVEVAYAAETQGYQVTVRKQSAKKTAAAEKEKASEKAAEKAASGPATIIIDPGHGGKDQGAMVSGVNEALVTLAVGQELKTALTKLGYKAMMTRSSDTFISLQDRPKFASEQGGDLFVSLHCNSIAGSLKHKKTISGFTAYILREGESEEDKALARRENQAITDEGGKSKSEISPVEWILLEHQLNLYSKESEGFAEDLVQEFSGFEIGKYATGAGQAGFYVLVGAYMPAVLFEMGYLTNDSDRRVLASEKGRKQIAARVAKAIDGFMKSSRESSGKEVKSQNSK